MFFFIVLAHGHFTSERNHKSTQLRGNTGLCKATSVVA